jgi:phosphoserine phosphatase
MERNYLILCDIDDTLFRSNTTYEFVAYVLRSFPARLWQMKLLTGRWSPFFLVLTALGKLGGRDLIKERSLLLLRGLDATLLEQQAPQFYEECLASQINFEVLSLLQSKRGEQFLISSTLDAVAQIIGQRLGMAPLSSTAEVTQGRLTGRLSNDLTGRKHEIALQLTSKYPGRRLLVVTDNRSDYDLVAMAEDRFVVIRKESDKLFWSDLHPSYLRG